MKELPKKIISLTIMAFKKSTQNIMIRIKNMKKMNSSLKKLKNMNKMKVMVIQLRRNMKFMVSSQLKKRKRRINININKKRKMITLNNIITTI